MAAVVTTADMTIQKNSSILVNVEEALTDLIVVSYSTEDTKFEGVLLDIKKRDLPFGVYSLHPALSSQQATIEKKDDKLHSVSQRFTYQEPEYISQEGLSGKKSGGKTKPQVRQKMTVRLRPRKVLCSNCKGICNENNENVDVIRKRKLESNDITFVDNKTSDNSNCDVNKKFLMGNTLIPKLSRLHPNEITNAIKGSTKVKSLNVGKMGLNKTCDKMDSNSSGEKSSDFDRVTHEVAFIDVSENFEKTLDYDVKTDKSDSNKDHSEGTFNTVFSSAKTLKISFGAGEGTVVKIPAIVGDYNEDSGVSCDMSKPSKQINSKAAKKALKRAKRQAKKNVETKNIQSPKHIGALSPHNNMSINSPIIDPLQKKHKHKMKHKRKNKISNPLVGDENTGKSMECEGINYFSDIKQHCLKQKLSISLRRLSSNSYERRCEQEGNESGSDGWESDVVPEFPAAGTEVVGGKPLRVSPGDVVWGKVVGFPWWPGRVLSVTSSLSAHVSWYASTTSSLMPCDSLSPFLEDYKLRYNKKKRGPYKEAVKQATLEAKKIESQDPLASPTHANLPTMSPRPINVFS